MAIGCSTVQYRHSTDNCNLLSATTFGIIAVTGPVKRVQYRVFKSLALCSCVLSRCLEPYALLGKMLSWPFVVVSGFYMLLEWEPESGSKFLVQQTKHYMGNCSILDFLTFVVGYRSLSVIMEALFLPLFFLPQRYIQPHPRCGDLAWRIVS